MGKNISEKTLKKILATPRSIMIGFSLLLGGAGAMLTLSLLAVTPHTSVEPESGVKSGSVTNKMSTDASGGAYIRFGQGDDQSEYAQDLAKIKAQPWRNEMQDDSPYASWSMSHIDQNVSLLFGPKKDYDDGRFAEQNLDAEANTGAVRIGCEFSHFAYDDPILYPGQPQVAHLHMFFGNTDTNAYSTNQSIKDSGGGTCNGGELDRSAYWVPAMFDDKGNVRVPMFMNIYYKNDNMNSTGRVSNKQTKVEPYPDGARFIASKITRTVKGQPVSQDVAGVEKASFMCIDEFGGTKSARVQYLSDIKVQNGGGGCWTGDTYYGVLPVKHYLEQSVMFPNCWNGQDPSNIANYTVSRYAQTPTGSTDLDSRLGFFGGVCPAPFTHRLPDLWYRIRYTLEPGDDPSKWFLSSDIDRSTLQRSTTNGVTNPGGASNHGDWWNGWSPTINQTWVAQCANTMGASCGFGYLDGKSLDEAPDGPALKYRHKDVYKPADFTASDYGCDGINKASYLCNLKSTPGNYHCDLVAIDMNQDDSNYAQTHNFCSIDRIPAQDVFDSLCSVAYHLERSSQAAYCKNPAGAPSASMHSSMSM